jgi:hypothetical protein
MVLPFNNNYHPMTILPSLSSPMVLKQFSTFNKYPKKNQGQVQEMTKAKDNQTFSQTKSKVYGNQREALQNPAS